MLRFHCPRCKKPTKVEVVMTDCVVSEVIDTDDDGAVFYDYPTIHESQNDHYQCSECGYTVPVDYVSPVDDDSLIEYLEKQSSEERKSK